MENTNELREITAEQAETLAKLPGAIYLNGLTTLTDKAAEALAKHDGELYLDGLTRISDPAIEALLAPSRDWLSLGGLTTLTDRAAEAVDRHVWGHGSVWINKKATAALRKYHSRVAHEPAWKENYRRNKRELEDKMEVRDEALSGSGLYLSAQMEGGISTIFDYLEYYCGCIENYGLKPWGRKGREYLNAGVEELITEGDCEHLMMCDTCHEYFLVRVDPKTVDLYLKYRKDEIEFREFMKCLECGGAIEEEGEGK